jgi:hypothetical protein
MNGLNLPSYCYLNGLSGARFAEELREALRTRNPANKWCPNLSSCTTPDSDDMCHGNYAHCGIYQENLRGNQ